MSLSAQSAGATHPGVVIGRARPPHHLPVLPRSRAAYATLLAACAGLAAAPAAFADAFTWRNPANSGIWNDTANWNQDGAAANRIPGANDDVTILLNNSVLEVQVDHADSITVRSLNVDRGVLKSTRNAAFSVTTTNILGIDTSGRIYSPPGKSLTLESTNGQLLVSGVARVPLMENQPAGSITLRAGAAQGYAIAVGGTVEASRSERLNDRDGGDVTLQPTGGGGVWVSVGGTVSAGDGFTTFRLPNPANNNDFGGKGGDVTITGSDFANDGSVYSGHGGHGKVQGGKSGDITINMTGDLDNRGVINARIAGDSRSSDQNGAQCGEGGKVTLTAAGNITNRAAITGGGGGSAASVLAFNSRAAGGVGGKVTITGAKFKGEPNSSVNGGRGGDSDNSGGNGGKTEITTTANAADDFINKGTLRGGNGGATNGSVRTAKNGDGADLTINGKNYNADGQTGGILKGGDAGAGAGLRGKRGAVTVTGRDSVALTTGDVVDGSTVTISVNPGGALDLRALDAGGITADTSIRISAGSSSTPILLQGAAPDSLVAGLDICLLGQPVLSPGVTLAQLTDPDASNTSSPCPAPTSLLYENGPLATGSTTLSGVAAPTGAMWSEVARDCADPTTANTIAGSRANGGTLTDRIADDFSVPAGGWHLTSINFYGYQTGSSTTSTFTGATLRIWNGNPASGGAVIWGDTTTNRLTSTDFSGIYRTFNTVTPLTCAGTPLLPTTERPIMNIAVSVGTTLPAGTYWLDWNYSGTAASGPWAPLTTLAHCGRAANPEANALQFPDGVGAWVPIADGGQGCAPTPVSQDFAFLIFGVAGEACYANCDQSTTTPFLNVNDFICFQGRFAASDPYADCDGNLTLNVNDFICFQGAFAAGCSAP